MEIEDYFLVQAACTLALVDMLRSIDPSPWSDDDRAEILRGGVNGAASLARGSIPDGDEFAEWLVGRSMVHFSNLGGDLVENGHPVTLQDLPDYADL